MSRRLKVILAYWFAVQIVLPFTAPLQTCPLADLLSGTHDQSVPLPESTATPTTDTAETFISPFDASVLTAWAHMTTPVRTAECGRPSRPVLFESPQPDQHTVLRV